jgi:dinuclear metal center YbgI/SA1388 family protein
MDFAKVLKKLETLSPPRFAIGDDNVGFLVGRRDKEITKVCLALDASPEVVTQAIAEGADLLLTHHPLIYGSLRQILAEDIVGSRLIQLIRHDINYVAMHTNYDVRGMAELTAEMLELVDARVLYTTTTESKVAEGVGRYGLLPQQMTLGECAEYVKSKFNLESVRVCGDMERVVTTAAISPGSSGGILNYAVAAGVDVLITGDIKDPMAVDARAHGLALIDGGHYGTEKVFVPDLADYFRREMAGVEVYIAREGEIWTNR